MLIKRCTDHRQRSIDPFFLVYHMAHMIILLY
jgi:hypothetical protein